MKRFVFSILVLSYFLLTPGAVLAIDKDTCERELNAHVNDHLTECISLLTDLIADTERKALSLTTEITKFNANIALTNAQIFQTTNQIQGLEQDITNLTFKITTLDSSLDELTKILITRIDQTYKQAKSTTPLAIFLASSGFSDFLSRYKYLRVVQLHDRKLLLEMETARTNFDDQKTLKQQKQDELELAKTKLEGQQRSLAQQKKDREQLLIVTKNNEATFNNLLKTAQAQLASLRGYTSSQSGGILPPQNSPDNWFYSQRDERWATKTIGYSSENILDVGCLVSSVAMVSTFYNDRRTPLDIANHTGYFFDRTAYMLIPWPTVAGKTPKYLSSLAQINSELDQNHPVIVHLSLGGDGHFVVLKKRDGAGYIMHDPWQGYDKKFTDYYSLSSITTKVVYN